MGKAGEGMTGRQRAFVAAYLGEARYNATAAARMAGYRWPNKVGPVLLHHPRVGPIIERVFQQRSKEVARRRCT